MNKIFHHDYQDIILGDVLQPNSIRDSRLGSFIVLGYSLLVFSVECVSPAYFINDALHCSMSLLHAINSNGLAIESLVAYEDSGSEDSISSRVNIRPPILTWTSTNFLQYQYMLWTRNFASNVDSHPRLILFLCPVPPRILFKAGIQDDLSQLLSGNRCQCDLVLTPHGKHSIPDFGGPYYLKNFILYLQSISRYKEIGSRSSKVLWRKFYLMLPNSI